MSAFGSGKDHSPDYPEHEKMQAVSDESQAIGQFLDWLGSEGMTVCELHHTITEECGQCSGRGWIDFEDYRCGSCHGAGEITEQWITPRWLPTGKSIQRLLAQYFGITLERIEAEKRAMLAALREAQS